MSNQMTINAIHADPHVIRFKTPLVFTLHETDEEGIYYAEWPGMGFAVEGEKEVVHQQILEYLIWLYTEYVIKGHKNGNMLMQKRIEMLFE